MFGSLITFRKREREEECVCACVKHVYTRVVVNVNAQECVCVFVFCCLPIYKRESKRISVLHRPYARGCTHVSVWLLAAYLLILDLGLVY